MKVILQQDVKGQGKQGQMINVSDGYARNFLLPRKLAVEATPDAINAMKLQEKARLAQEAKEKQESADLAAKLEGCMVKVSARAGEKGQLFGSITSKEVSEALLAQHQINIEKQKIVQEEPIKSFGSYHLKCKLGYGVSGTIHLMVTEEK